jgi:flavin reductase (DIM6/NTAB) family NADH-FMN oxidoreductase RutF
MSTPTEGALQGLATTLGRVPSGLYILTARHGERETGMLASWVQQCSFDPPQVTVAVRQGREVLAWLTDGSPFTLNLLAEGQSNLISHFGKGFTLDQPAFTGLNVERIDGKPPVLLDTLGHLECRVVTRLLCGDHEVMVGVVVAGRLHQPEGKPWVHVRKSGLRY